jgi:hypothetical protein
MSPQTAEDTDSTHIQTQADRMWRGAGASGAAQAERGGWLATAAGGGGGRSAASCRVFDFTVLNESQGKKKVGNKNSNFRGGGLWSKAEM